MLKFPPRVLTVGQRELIETVTPGVARFFAMVRNSSVSPGLLPG